MNEPLYKEVNIIDKRTGRTILDKETGKPVSRRVLMSDDEAQAFLAEQAAQQNMEQQP